jgi:hypothetical protein
VNLADLLSGLHADILGRLSLIRKTLTHPTDKGDASEEVWLQLFSDYLPQRYQARKAYVVDSRGAFSEQIDVVVFDRQYTPFIFNYQGKCVVPAESVYAVFEAKQTLCRHNIEYGQKKISSVRRLHRTSLAIPHAGGVYPPKPLVRIIGGFVCLASDYRPPFGGAAEDQLAVDKQDGQIDIGCIADTGTFSLNQEAGYYDFQASDKAATAFLFDLIARLQASATVPMIDVRAYAEWLT